VKEEEKKAQVISYAEAMLLAENAKKLVAARSERKQRTENREDARNI